MHRLWTYEDYVEHLSHPDSLVRTWAYYGIENQYPQRFCREVSRLIDDSDQHLACRAPQYVAKHGAVEFAPAILECFMNREGMVAANCSIALGKLKYEAAFEKMVDRLQNTKDIETFVGIAEYLGFIRTRESHDILLAVFDRFADSMFSGSGVESLMAHGNPEDVPRVVEFLSGRTGDVYKLERPLTGLMNSVGAGGIFSDLTDQAQEDILGAPRKALENLLDRNPGLALSRELQKEIVRELEERRYKELCAHLLSHATDTAKERYPDEDNIPEFLEKTYQLDLLCISVLRCMTGGHVKWNRFKNEDVLKMFAAAAVASHLSILERGAYLKALAPDAPTPTLIEAIQRSGRDCPETIMDRLVSQAPVDELKHALSRELLGWGDIRIVNIMGRIGAGDFVADLVRVFRDADFLDFVYEDAISALHGIEESGHEAIFSAIRNHDIPDTSTIFSLLEHLPHAESFDIAYRLWNDDEIDDFDSLELYGHCLQGIGDRRGIRALQEIFHESNSVYMGNSLETLALLYSEDIPELPVIRAKRREEEKRRKERAHNLNLMAEKAVGKKSAGLVSGVDAGSVKTVKRSAPKTGRNEPCPCGSGKKYKKCCLNKSS